MTQNSASSGADTVRNMCEYIWAAFFSWATLVGLLTGISGVTVLTLVQGRVQWWIMALAGAAFVVAVLLDALRRAVTAAAEAQERSSIIVHHAVGGRGGEGNGGVGGAGGSNYIGTFTRSTQNGT
ncbi:hypothetical protein [Nocardia flavorosea]|uniref:hypothetical protein n=1 Tax=Nocardia flavorosea TaxID=53429 RepID=UPI0024543D74|nr:hypothetical protein [Nocardia flavorosea]